MKTAGTHLAIILFGMVMVYPLAWLVSAALKPSNEVMTTSSLIPSTLVWQNFVDGWYMIKPYGFGLFFKNTFTLVILCVIGSVFCSLVVGYGFSRFNFKYKKILFSVLFVTIMLPATVTLIPRYIIFAKLGWLNTYLPFIIPAFLGAGPGGGFFIFLIHQYMKNIPKELDEAAKIDGCNVLQILFKIIAPLSMSAMFSVCIFAFMWNWDDFQNQLIYLSKVDNYTIALALRNSIDVTGASNWGAVLSMALCSMIPIVVMFALAQKHFIEGVAATGIKE